MLAAMCSAVILSTPAFAAHAVQERAFDPAAWPKARSAQADLVRKSMVRDLAAKGALLGKAKAEVLALLGPAEEPPGALLYPLGEDPVGAYNPVAVMVLLDRSDHVMAVVTQDKAMTRSGATRSSLPGERYFDAAAWPKQLVVRQVRSPTGAVAAEPDMTRKSMVRDLIATGYLIGMSRAEVVRVLGEAELADGVLIYPLGDKPLGKFNPIALGIGFDEAGKAVVAEAVGAE